MLQVVEERTSVCLVIVMSRIQGNINLVTRALAAVGRKMELIPDPTTVHYHLPNDFNVQVHRKFEDFLNELYKRFPEERAGIDGFFGECWRVHLLCHVAFVFSFFIISLLIL